MREWVIPYMKENKKRIILSIFIGVLGIGSGAMLLFVSGYLISKSSLMPVNVMAVYVPIVSVRAFSIGKAVFAYLEKLISHDIVLRILERMRRRLYDIVEPKALFLRSKYQTGDLLGVLSDDIEHLQDLYLRTIFPSIIGLTIYTIIVVIFGAFSLTFGLLIAALLGIIVFIIPYISLRLNKREQEHRKKNQHQLYNKLTDAIFGMTDWKASGREKQFLEEMSLSDENITNTERKIKRIQHIRDAFIQFVIGIVVIAVMIWASIQANEGIIEPTVIAAFVLMIFSIGDALFPISEAVELAPIYTDSLTRVKQVETVDLPSVYRKESEEINIQRPIIEISNLSYTYPGEKEKVIDHLSLTIKPGEKIAILGRSGTGKSTLLKLLAGVLEPREGTVRIDHQKMNSDLLAKIVSVLNQKPHLFSTSVANNIRVGRPDASEEEIIEAVEKAQLTTLINSLPEGLNTHMQEMGHRFSGGERQRIAFARVLLQDTPIILVDEATIGLDPVTERKLIETIFSAAKEKTIIWVTHHLAGVDHMDRIIFMEDGKIKMDGSHEELLKKEEHYRRLYEMDQGFSF